jgi:hypothetical protein
MPHNNYSAQSYFQASGKSLFNKLVVTDNLWLNNNANLVGGKYTTTYPNTNKKSSILTDPFKISELYYMSNFIYNSDNDVSKNINGTTNYSKGTLWVGNSTDNQVFGLGMNGKIDIQTFCRSIARQEIEYSLWLYTKKLIENNNSPDGTNLIDNLKINNLEKFKLVWFNFDYGPTQRNVTSLGFPTGTDNTSWNTKMNQDDINLKKKIILNI